MNFVELTFYRDKKKAIFNLSNVAVISPCLEKNSGRDIENGSQIVMVSGEYYWIDETYEQVVSLIKQFKE